MAQPAAAVSGRPSGGATTTWVTGSYGISGVPQTMRSARSQVRWAVLNGTSSAVHPSWSGGDPSGGMLARSIASISRSRTAARRAASRWSDCTQITVSMRDATSRRPAPSPSMISSGHPAGTSMDPARPCSPHRGGR